MVAPIILGGGLSGCLAAVLFPGAVVLEASDELKVNHRAVLRFRSEEISKATGIPFRRVNVRKAIWTKGELFDRPSIQHLNWYSRKVAQGRVTDRSIADTTPAIRWIAPEDFHEQLAARVNVHYGRKVEAVSREAVRSSAGTLHRAADTSLISTLPMSVMLRLVGAAPPTVAPAFNYATIRVTRYRVAKADVFQTIYFPDPYCPEYRATLTGSELIVEAISNDQPKMGLDEITRAFGLYMEDAEFIGTQEQSLGKILPLPREQRNALMLWLTQDYGIYSLGRFACWRNIVLDDVFNDCAVIARMMAADRYTFRKEWAR